MFQAHSFKKLLFVKVSLFARFINLFRFISRNLLQIKKEDKLKLITCGFLERVLFIGCFIKLDKVIKIN